MSTITMGRYKVDVLFGADVGEWASLEADDGAWTLAVFEQSAILGMRGEGELGSVKLQSTPDQILAMGPEVAELYGLDIDAYDIGEAFAACQIAFDASKARRERLRAEEAKATAEPQALITANDTTTVGEVA